VSANHKGCVHPRERHEEAGYALVMALFLAMAIIIGAQVMLHNLATDGRRQRESEEIWRGNQVIRAIRIFYRKTGHYPQTMDDLQKGLPGVQFLRPEAATDPMNKDDGSWRFIYVNGAGQIIGSVRYASLQQMALIDLNGGKLPGAQQGTAAGSSSQSSESDSGSQQSDSQQQSTQGEQQAGQGGQQSSAQAPQPQQPNQPFGAPPPAPSSSNGGNTLGLGTSAASGQVPASVLQAQPTGPVDGPVLGGLLTGVASKIDHPSLKVYKGGKTYQQWEFIWNPLEDQGRALQNGLAPQGQQPGVGLPIANPNGGGTTGTPGNPPTGLPGPGAQPPGAAPQTPPDLPLTQ